MNRRPHSPQEHATTQPRVATLACALILLLISAAGGGCAFDIYKPGAVGKAITIDPDADGALIAPAGDDSAGTQTWAEQGNWPDRWPVWSGLRRSTVETSRARVMGTVVRLPRAVHPMGSGSDAEQRINREQQADVNLLMSRRRIRVGDVTLKFEGEGPGSFVFAEDEGRSSQDHADAAMYLKFVSGREMPLDGSTKGGRAEILVRPSDSFSSSSERTRLVQIQRTWFAYFNPETGTPSTPGQVRLTRPRGIAVVLPGIFGTPDNVVNPLIRKLRERGWGVLFMLAQPSRFTEHARFEIDERTDFDATGRQIADLLTDRACECAYSVHGAMLYVRQNVPGARELPVSIVGMSGGAMMLSTIVARDPEMFQSAVTIAGGADFLGIALESAYTGWINAVRVMIKSEANEPELARRLMTAYHQHAPLDSTRTFEVLSKMPTLMIHANHDRAVPARYGDLAWRLAGKPERWTIGMGHELLFMTLPWHLDRVCDWVVKRTSAPAPVPASNGATPPSTQVVTRRAAEPRTPAPAAPTGFTRNALPPGPASGSVPE